MSKAQRQDVAQARESKRKCENMENPWTDDELSDDSESNYEQIKGAIYKNVQAKVEKETNENTKLYKKLEN